MNAELSNTIKKLFEDCRFALRASASDSVLCAVCDRTVTFQKLSGFYDAARRAASEHNSTIDVLLATDRSDLVVTVRVGKKRARDSEARVDSSGKASNDELRDRVKEAIDKLKKTSGESLSKQELDSAQSVCDSTVCLLLSVDASEERAVQSFGAFYKKLSASDSKARVVLGFRIHAGLAFKLGDLKSCMGSCWVDGAITTEDTLHSVDSMSLPLSPEGVLSRKYGNEPMLVVTSVSP